MSSFSAQPTYSINSDDTITITSGIDLNDINYSTITITPTPSISTINIGAVGSSSYTYTSGINTISTAGFDPGTFQINLPAEWVNCFPDWSRIEKMCNEYPGLKIAFDKFKTTYYLVKDDYDTPKDNK